MTSRKTTIAGQTAPRLEPLEPRLLLDAGQVVINEIMFHPGFGDIGQPGYVAENLAEEYIELFNRGTDPVSLNGWQFTQGVDFGLPDVSIPGQGYLVVAADVSAFMAKYPTVDPAKVVGGWTGRLGNAGQDLELENDLGLRVDFVSYSDEGDWAVREKAIPLPVTSLVLSGTTVTATVYGHGFVNGDYIRIAGATQTEYNSAANRAFQISNVTPDTFTYTITGTPVSPATGTITAQKTDLCYVGWEWSNATDGGGKSLELINPLLSNERGQNWAASIPLNGTPGAVNSVAASDIAPMILDVTHLPAIPRSVDPVTVTASILDELGTSANVTLYWRRDANPQTAPFAASTMYDDGQHGDGLAGDGLYGAVIPAQPDTTIVEFYLQAVDAGGKSRTWPAPVPGYGQAANLLYQVDNTYDPNAAWTPGSPPSYRMIMTAAEWVTLQSLLNESSGVPYGHSNANMNGTFISIDGTGTEVAYLAGYRSRGNGSRHGTPHNFHINIPHDHRWNGVLAININARNTYSQAIGSEIFHAAGIGGPTEVPVQVRINGGNYAVAGAGMYGLYVAKEEFDSDLAAQWFPDDPSGDLYQAFYDDSVSPRDVADLRYEGESPDPYRNTYFKRTNAAFDDWSGLIGMTRIFANEPDATFLQEISKVVNVDQWLRYIAVDSMLGNNEGGLCTGVGDDYALYQGVIDPRFVLMEHDLDSLVGIGGSVATRGIFDGYTGINALNRLLTNPELLPRYYAQYLDLIDTVFAPANFNLLVDRLFTGWLPADQIANIKTFNVNRIANVKGQIPQDLTVTSGLAQQYGYYRTTSATTTLSGVAAAALVRSVLVNGLAAAFTPRGATWTAGSVALAPGINRITVTAYDGLGGTGNVVDTATIDVWYDDGTTDDYPKTGGEPPPPPPAPVLTADLLVRNSYLPGTPVLVRVEALTDGVTDRGLWDATATLSVLDNPGITLSTSQVTLYNGMGSAAVTFTGSGSFTLTATVNGLSDTATLADLTGQPMTLVSGILNGSALDWSGIVHVTGDVTVPDGATLTLQPGTLVLVDGVASGTTGTDIDVLGAVQSLGTAAAPVTFTAYGSALAWGEIHHNSAEPSLYQYTEIMATGRAPGQGHTGTGPAFNVANSKITFDHAAITDLVGKIMQASSGSDLTFEHSLLARAVMGPEISGTALLFEDSWIYEMRSPNDSDGIYLHDQQAGQTITLIGGVIANVNDDCVDTLDSDVTIQDYILRNANDKGVSVLEGAVTIQHSLVVENNMAPEDPTVASIAAKTNAGGTATVNIDRTTVVTSPVAGYTDYAVQSNNKYSEAAGTVIWNITNSILQGTVPINVEAPYLASDVHVSYTNVVGQAWAGTGNLNAGPLFVSAAGHDYRLQAGSPSIDAGNPASAPDPDLTIADQGYYAFDQGDPALPPGSLTEDTVWAPAGGPYRIAGDLTVPFGITLTLLPGTSVYFEPNTKMVVQGRLIAEGTELQPIRFTRTPGAAGNWLGIQFDNTVRDNRLSYAVLEYGVTDSGMVGLTNSNLVIDHATFDHTDRRRIRTQNSSLIVRNSTFTDIFPGATAPTTNNLSEQIWGAAPTTGVFLIENNTFGTTKGHNDIIDVDGSSRPNTVIQILNNTFLGGGDEAIDIEGDAHIEGNTFTHFRKDAYNTDAGQSNVISAGAGKDYTVVRNFFYDIDHAALIKDGAFMTFVNNTVDTVAISALYFEVPGDSLFEGRGAYVDGSIFSNAALVFDQVHAGTQLAVNRSILPAAYHAYGVGNIDEAARLADPAGGDFRLRPGSPAIGTGPNGLDMGALVAAGASIAGEPASTIWTAGLTLTVGGPDLFAYKYRLDDGAWIEVANTAPGLPPAIVLTGLADGTHHVDVLARNSAGVLQDESQPTVSKTWTVNAALAPHVRINEVLASNVAAVPHGALTPDVIELYNDGQGPISLAGMYLTDSGGSRYTFDAGTTLAEGAYKVLYGGTDAATPADHLGFSLKESGDTLSLYDSGGNLIDRVTFGFQLADKSVGRKADGTWGLASPTFGGANAILRTGDPATLKINEWLANGDVRIDHDFVEIYNPDPLPVDMGGLYLSDEPFATRREYERHLADPANPLTPAPDAIPALSFIAAGPIVSGQALGGYAVFNADGDTLAGADHAAFKLNAFWGQIGLMDAASRIIDSLCYRSQATDISQGRTPLGATSLAFSRIPTPGIENPGATDVITSSTTTPIFDIANATYQWRYNDTGTNLHTAAGTKWNAFDYVDTGWGLSAGILNYERDTANHMQTFPDPWVVNKVLATTGATPNLCYYFRTHFTFAGDAAAATSLEFTAFLDDGAILYLNGTEIERLNISDTATVAFNMLASSARSSTTTLTAYSIPLAAFPGLLRQGENVLAVEVHQSSTGSSDVAWAASLDIKAVAQTAQRSVTIPATVQALADSLRVTELMYNAVGGSDYEYVELKNTSPTTTLDLAGVRISNGVDYVFSDTDPARYLAPGAYIVVAPNQTKFRTRYGSAPVLAAGVYTGKLSDSGENLTLKLPAPYDAAALRFDYQPTWYPTASGGGHSIVVADPTVRAAAWDERTTWTASVAVNGSPGAAEPAPSTSTVIITELMTHSDQDPPAGPGDWIELYNTSATDAAVLTGWYLSDKGSDLHAWQIPTLTLAPHEYKVFTERDDFGGAFALSELGEEVHLTNPSGTVHEIANFAAGEREVTFGRTTNSAGVVEYVPMSAATPGQANAAPKAGPIVISEIMYHPAADGDEFIELRNVTPADVPLYDINNPANVWEFTGGVDFAFAEGDFVPANGYALLVGGDPAAFRDKYGIPASVPIYGPYSGNLDNGGELLTLRKPGDPEPDTGEIPLYLVDHVLYDDVSPWPTAPDGSGPSLVRASDAAYGNDVLNWTTGAAYGTPGGVAGAAAPRILGISINGRDRGAGGIDPSGLGLRTVEITFSKSVAFIEADVQVAAVTFPGGGEYAVQALTAVLSGSGTRTMTLLLPPATLDTWVKIALSGSGTLRDLMGHLLDGEPAAGGNGLAFIRDSLDLPTGDGAAGGNALFYVGSLRGDFSGDGAVGTPDKAAFMAKWRAGDLDADFRGVGFGVRPPDGRVTLGDIDGFTSVYLAGVASGRHLDSLPAAMAPEAQGATGESQPAAAATPLNQILAAAAGVTQGAPSGALASAAGLQDDALADGLDVLAVQPLMQICGSDASSPAVMRI